MRFRYTHLEPIYIIVGIVIMQSKYFALQKVSVYIPSRAYSSIVVREFYHAPLNDMNDAPPVTGKPTLQSIVFLFIFWRSCDNWHEIRASPAGKALLQFFNNRLVQPTFRVVVWHEVPVCVRTSQMATSGASCGVVARRRVIVGVRLYA